MEDSSEFGSTWHASNVALPELRPSLGFDLDVDVCIVGGGIAGLTVAREMAKRGSSVALLEARRFAWNASGRNCGLVAAGFPAPVENIVERVGLSTAKDLWRLSETGVALLRGTLAELGLAEEGQGWLDVSRTADARAALHRAALINEEFRGEVEVWPVERVREAVKTRFYHHAVHFPRAFQINPLAYALALAETAQRAGAYMFERTPVVTLDPAGIRKRIVTAKSVIRAAHVVLAGNTQLGSVAPSVAGTLVPFTRYIGVTRPIGRRIVEAIQFKGMVSDSPHANYHYRVVGEDRLLWSGGAPLLRGIGAYGGIMVRRRFERAIEELYPVIGPVEFDSVWPGEIGVAVHRMPQIGEVWPGVWLASGFGGHGLHTATLAGHLIARAICEADDTWRQFLPFELVWAGGRAGRVIAKTVSWGEEQLSVLSARVMQGRDARRERRRRVAAGLPAEAPRPAYKVMNTAATPEAPRPPPASRWSEVAAAAAATAVPKAPDGMRPVPQTASPAQQAETVIAPQTGAGALPQTHRPAPVMPPPPVDLPPALQVSAAVADEPARPRTASPQ